MQKDYFKKMLSIILVFVILLTSIPSSVMAAVEDVSWDSAINDANYDYWELADKNMPKLAERTDNLRVPAINYRGTYSYKDADGTLRDVIRMSFSSANSGGPLLLNKWNKLAIKVPKELYEAIDWEDSNTGFYKFRKQNEYSDSPTYNVITKFSDASLEDVGAKNVKVIDLANNNNYDEGARGDIPFQFVLKSDKKFHNLSEDPLIQARVYQDNYKIVFSYVKELDESVKEIPYNNYTITSYIPLKDDFKPDLVSDINGNKTNMHSTHTFIKYNQDGGYIDVVYKMQKIDFGSHWFGNEMAVFQSFNKNFVNLLKPSNDDVVAVIALGDQEENFYSNAYKNGEFQDSNSVKVNMADINERGNIAFINVANKNWAKAYGEDIVNENDPKTMHSINKVTGVRTRLTNNPAEGTLINGSSTPNPGLSTIVRWYVDTDKVDKVFNSSTGLDNHAIFTSMIAQPNRDVPVYRYRYESASDKDFKKGDKVTITFPSNVTRHRVKINVGNDIHKIEFSSAIQTNRNVATLTFPYDLHLKAGTKVDIFAESGSKITINGPDNRPFDVDGEVDNRAGIIDAADTLIGGVIESSYPPKVDEIFTESKNITGYAKYDKAEVSIYTPESIKQLLSASNLNQNKKFKEQSQEKQNEFTYKEYKSYRFDTDNVNPAIRDVIKKYDAYNMPSLKKDMPVVLTASNIARGAVPSDEVIEQVQARVTFDLNGQTSKIDGKNTIEKIAPLNKEYLYTLKDGTFVINDNYKPSGFAKIEYNNIVGGDNLKISDKKIVRVTQNYVDSAGNKSSIEREVINYLDHNDKIYDISASDSGFKTQEINNLLKRQFPISEEINLPNAKHIIGWTTVKLEDKEVDGRTITAEEQYYDILKENKVVDEIEDWKEARSKAYIYNESSPLEMNETVYAVYGGLTLVLHSGNFDDNGKEIIVRVPIEQKDIDYTNTKTKEVDGTTSATMIIKEMPKAPYTNLPSDVAKADNQLQQFNKADHTFVGWTILKDQSSFKAGYNNDRISDLLAGKAKINGVEKNIYKETEALGNLIREMKNFNNTQYTMAIPNGFNLAISSKDFDSQGNFNTDSMMGLKSREALLSSVGEIHLYAVYRPYFNVTVNPQYKLTDRTGASPEYKDGVPEEKKRPLTIGIMNRTAVTGYDRPTSDAAANYNPIGDRTTLKEWNPKSGPQQLSWKLPGYDELGRRKSYVGVIVPEGKEEIYESFNKPFNEESWKKLGISTFTIQSGSAIDKHAPKNLYRDPNPNSNRDPYGVPLAKIQSFTFDNEDQGVKTIDAYTSATARASKIGKNSEVIGYNIVMTNVLESVPTPHFDKVRDTDKQIKLDWKDTKDYEAISKIDIYLDGYKYTLTGSNGTFKTVDSIIETKVENDKLVITGFTLSDKGGKSIQAMYTANFAGEEISGSMGTTRILTIKDSKAVNKMDQVRKENNDQPPAIKFTVPEKILDQVSSGSKYIAEKWDKSTEKWVRVGEKVLTEADKVHNMHQGNEHIIELNGVVDGDIIRIVAYEKDPDAEYTIEEKTENPALENTFSKPAYSTGDKTSAPEIKSGNEKVQYVTLDLTGPTGKITATDEKFRRFVNIKGMLSEIPDNQKVVLKFSDSTREDIVFETKEKAVAYLNQLIRLEEMPEMTIVAKDRYGNIGETEVKYTKTYQLQIFVTDAKQGKKYVNVSSDMEGAIIEATVYDGMTELAKGEVTLGDPEKSQRLKLYDINNQSKEYRLQKGNRIHFEGSAKKDGNTHTANPFDVFVK